MGLLIWLKDKLTAKRAKKTKCKHAILKNIEEDIAYKQLTRCFVKLGGYTVWACSLTEKPYYICGNPEDCARYEPED